MFVLQPPPQPEWHELIPARNGLPPVRVRFAPIGRKARRTGQRAASATIRAQAGEVEPDAELDEDVIFDAGDALSRELIRAGILEWEGIGDADGNPVAVTPETIELFLANDELFEAADAKYVLPWSLRSAEKNGSPPSPAGIGAGATPENDTAS